jgi:hypothetical protein
MQGKRDFLYVPFVRQSILDNVTAVFAGVIEDIPFWQTNEHSVSVKETDSPTG